MRTTRALLVALAFVLLAAPLGAKPRPGDTVWLNPDFAKIDLKSIAMLPVATFDHNTEAEKIVAASFGPALGNTGYRWVSSNSTYDQLRGMAPMDSLVKVVKDAILKNPRIDSLAAPAWCGRFRTQAILAVLIDRWEQVRIEWDQSGKPSTTIALKAALVDTTGRLLWTCTGTETVEGIYKDAGNNPYAGTGITSQATAGPGVPPPYVDVLDRILTRWSKLFPAKASTADGPH